jgi:hypothetical protein
MSIMSRGRRSRISRKAAIFDLDGTLFEDDRLTEIELIDDIENPPGELVVAGGPQQMSSGVEVDLSPSILG